MSGRRIIPAPPAPWASWDDLMRLALEEAAAAFGAGEVPVGAVVVGRDGLILGRGRNSPVGDTDPSAHAEMNALRQAALACRNYRLNDAFLVATLEPCLMCVGACVQARLAGVVYGARDPKAGAVESRLGGFELDFINHQPWSLGGILEESCAALLEEFFARRR
jgi:tRNA(adenine34) deaminase